MSTHSDDEIDTFRSSCWPRLVRAVRRPFAKVRPHRSIRRGRHGLFSFSPAPPTQIQSIGVDQRHLLYSDCLPDAVSATIRHSQLPTIVEEPTVKARNPIVIHYVHDMKRAIAFYTGAFDVKPSFESDGWTQLDFGWVDVALHIIDPSWGPENESLLPHAGLNLEVDHIEAIQADIERLGGKLIELRQEP